MLHLYASPWMLSPDASMGRSLARLVSLPGPGRQGAIPLATAERVTLHGSGVSSARSVLFPRMDRGEGQRSCGRLWEVRAGNEPRIERARDKAALSPIGASVARTSDHLQQVVLDQSIHRLSRRAAGPRGSAWKGEAPDPSPGNRGRDGCPRRRSRAGGDTSRGPRPSFRTGVGNNTVARDAAASADTPGRLHPRGFSAPPRTARGSRGAIHASCPVPSPEWKALPGQRGQATA